MDPLTQLGLMLLAFGAAVINGATGYGFSSIITPVGILWVSNQVLNPALVMVELGVNAVLLYRVRAAAPAAWSRARPIVLTLLPGVVIGTLALSLLAVNDVKVIVYAVLFPLVILQLLGISRPLRSEAKGAAAIGPGIGFLYALTTISGPPLALFLRNQGLAQNEFRATISEIRLAESSLTLMVYASFGGVGGIHLISWTSMSLVPFLAIPAALGIPIGVYLLRSASPDLFRRFVMEVDGFFIAYGLSTVLVAIGILTALYSYLSFALLALVVAGLWMVPVGRRRNTGSPVREPPPDYPKLPRDESRDLG